MDDILQMNVENCILIQISPKCPTVNQSTCVHVMAWRQTDEKFLPELMAFQQQTKQNAVFCCVGLYLRRHMALLCHNEYPLQSIFCEPICLRFVLCIWFPSPTGIWSPLFKKKLTDLLSALPVTIVVARHVSILLHHLDVYFALWVNQIVY